MRCSTMMQYYYMKIFFYGKKVFTAGSCLQPAVLMSPSPTVPDTNQRCWCPYHQRFWNRRWWPRYHQRLKSNGTQNCWWCTFRTGGDRGGCSSARSLSGIATRIYPHRTIAIINAKSTHVIELLSRGADLNMQSSKLMQPRNCKNCPT